MEIHISNLLIFIFATMTCINAYAQWDRERTRYWLLIAITFSIYGVNQFLLSANPPSNWNHFANVIVTMFLCYALVIEITSSNFTGVFLKYIIIVALLVFSLLQFLLNFFPGKFDDRINRFLQLLLPLWTLLMYGILTVDWYKSRDRYLYQLVMGASAALALSLIFSSLAIIQLSNFFGLTSCLAFYFYTHYSIRHYWRGIARQNIELHRGCNIGMRIQERIGSTSKTALDLQNVLQTITDSALLSVSASAGAIFLLQEDGILRAQCVKGIFPPFEKVTEDIAKNPRLLVDSLKSQKIVIGGGIIGEAATASRAILIQDALSDDRIYQAVPETAPIKTLIAAPIRIASELLGVIAVINKEDDTKTFSQNDQNLMYNIARQAAVAIKTAQFHKDIVAERIIAQEMKQAQQIQSNILSHECPRMESIEVAAEIRSARMVGGDYYHFFPYDDERMGIAIGDVSGKGFPAALVAMTLHTLLHEQAVDGVSSNTVISNLNNAMLNMLHANEMIVTLIYGVWDGMTRRFTFSNAGHPRPFIVHAKTGACETVEESDIAIGIWQDISATETSICLARNDIILMFTDGVEEAVDVNFEMFGIERIKRFLVENSHLSAEELSAKLLSELEQFTEGANIHDDYTFIVLKVR
ncbi:TPA: GAF domain-containing protein [Candidatus Poribacteria bacterium]|nr:GAF domain-containing protein [Candidatus Poribacteria bacterium]